MTVGILLQARTGSTRLPGKIFMDLNGQYSIQRILAGCKKTIIPNKIILCMPKEDRKEIEGRIARGELDGCTDDRFSLFISEGDSNDLINRFYRAARKYNIDTVVRLTCDNPMLEGANDIIDDMLSVYLNLPKNGSGGYFMGNNDSVATRDFFPNGLDVEIFSYYMLCWARRRIIDAHNKEHCATSFYTGVGKQNFATIPFENHGRISMRIPSFTMDTAEDYKLLVKLTAAYDKTHDINKAIESVEL